MTAPKKRQRAPGGGRKSKDYVILSTCRLPAGIPEKIAEEKRAGESIGETIARKFGWEPKPKI